MKCEYCQGEDHLISACGRKKGDRIFMAGGGWLFIVIFSPFMIVGSVVGAIASFFMAGFRSSIDLWRVILRVILEKKDDEHAL